MTKYQNTTEALCVAIAMLEAIREGKTFSAFDYTEKLFAMRDARDADLPIGERGSTQSKLTREMFLEAAANYRKPDGRTQTVQFMLNLFGDMGLSAELANEACLAFATGHFSDMSRCTVWAGLAQEGI